MQNTQENQLYVFDPKALQHIVLKVRFIHSSYLSIMDPIFGQDQDIYEQTTAFIEYLPVIIALVDPRALKSDS